MLEETKNAEIEEEATDPGLDYAVTIVEKIQARNFTRSGLEQILGTLIGYISNPDNPDGIVQIINRFQFPGAVDSFLDIHKANDIQLFGQPSEED